MPKNTELLQNRDVTEGRPHFNPTCYLAEQHQRYLKVVNTKHPYDWGATTVKVILQNKVHLGHMVSHKTTNSAEAL
ncbi:hypothetical protein J7E73_08420 [Paenibacillus albidus]|uniref:recombinase family protein n=1 Tax=Paenibacillus albidus TaxID=2041023 RepID=UPI001BED2EF2|nr:recombinase family protein [Paenibacillus albidus]MBT2289156.1 hypothetical protein [Paenibacillus albidus]